MKIQKIIPALVILTLIYPGILFCQGKGTAKIALVQATAKKNQDPFMGDYEPERVRPLMTENFNHILDLFEKAGQMDADLVCGPEDMQNIGSYGLHIDKKDPV